MDPFFIKIMKIVVYSFMDMIQAGFVALYSFLSSDFKRNNKKKKPFSWTLKISLQAPVPDWCNELHS